MTMPTLTDAHHKLALLAGRWQGTERIHPSHFDPTGGEATGWVKNRIALDGFAVVQDYEQERDGAVNFHGHGVFRWDPGHGAYVLHWFDSLGGPPVEFRGGFDGDTLTLTASMPGGFSRATFAFAGHDRYAYRMDVSPDGARWQTFLDGEYQRED